jgi:hypothetical protein
MTASLRLLQKVWTFCLIWIADSMSCLCSEPFPYAPTSSLSSLLKRPLQQIGSQRNFIFPQLRSPCVSPSCNTTKGIRCFPGIPVSHLLAIERVGCHIAYCRMTMPSTNCDHRTDCRPPHPRPPTPGHTHFRTNIGSHHTWRRLTNPQIELQQTCAGRTSPASDLCTTVAFSGGTRHSRALCNALSPPRRLFRT